MMTLFLWYTHPFLIIITHIIPQQIQEGYHHKFIYKFLFPEYWSLLSTCILDSHSLRPYLQQSLFRPLSSTITRLNLQWFRPYLQQTIIWTWKNNQSFVSTFTNHLPRHYLEQSLLQTLSSAIIPLDFTFNNHSFRTYLQQSSFGP